MRHILFGDSLYDSPWILEPVLVYDLRDIRRRNESKSKPRQIFGLGPAKTLSVPTSATFTAPVEICYLCNATQVDIDSCKIRDWAKFPIFELYLQKLWAPKIDGSILPWQLMREVLNYAGFAKVFSIWSWTFSAMVSTPLWGVQAKELSRVNLLRTSRRQYVEIGFPVSNILISLGHKSCTLLLGLLRQLLPHFLLRYLVLGICCQADPSITGTWWLSPLLAVLALPLGGY